MQEGQELAHTHTLAWVRCVLSPRPVHLTTLRLFPHLKWRNSSLVHTDFVSVQSNIVNQQLPRTRHLLRSTSETFCREHFRSLQGPSKREPPPWSRSFATGPLSEFPGQTLCSVQVISFSFLWMQRSQMRGHL